MIQPTPDPQQPRWHTWIILGVPLMIAVCWLIRDFDYEPLLVTIELITGIGGIALVIKKYRLAHWMMIAYALVGVLVSGIMFFLTTPSKAHDAGIPPLLATPSSIPSRMDFLEWPIVYQTTFDPTPAQWFLGEKDDEFMLLQTASHDGRYTVTTTTKRDVTTWVNSPLPQPSNFALSFTVTKVEGPKDGSCGAIFRWQDALGGYYFRISPETQRFDITYPRSRTAIGWDSVFSGWQSTPVINPQTSNTITLIADESSLEVIINGVTVGTATSVSYRTGRIDLALQYPHNEASVTVACAFDDVILREKP